MALEKKDLKLLAELRKCYPNGDDLCILGDCHFHFNNEELHEICGIKKNNSDNLLRTDLDSLKSAMNFKKAETLDIEGSPTIKLDLQNPIPKDLENRFDWIIDAGTLFWCFDIASVWKNILSMLKEDGCVFHLNAMSGYFGRGYYSFQPHLFTDFYNQNGFEVITLAFRLRPPHILIKKRTLISKLKESFHNITGLEKKHDWQKIPQKYIFLNKAGRLEMKFSDSMAGIEPDMIPNNAIVGCFARRIKKVPFTSPIPKK